MTLLLMAAGSGSRYGKLKQFDDLGPNGEFLMEFSIFDAISHGFDHIVVITKEANQEFLKMHLSQRLGNAVKLDVLVQKIDDIPEGSHIQGTREKPWGQLMPYGQQDTSFNPLSSSLMLTIITAKKPFRVRLILLNHSKIKIHLP